MAPLHVPAFEEFGGIVETVVPDDLQVAVIRAAFGMRADGAHPQPRARAHYGFKVDPTRACDPEKKGR